MKYRQTSGKKVEPIGFSCRKAVYHTREEAQAVIDHIKETRVTREIKPYQCTVCGFWHLTSRGK